MSLRVLLKRNEKIRNLSNIFDFLESIILLKVTELKNLEKLFYFIFFSITQRLRIFRLRKVF